MIVRNFCKALAVGVILGPLFVVAAAQAADDATVKLYQTKCAACHGADGSGNTPVGKALMLRDIRDPEVQKMSDADLATLYAKGKGKMPANEKSLKPDQIQALVAYTRELATKK